jgi:hypothetical protein
MKPIRWSDDDRYFGPFTYAYDKRFKPIAVLFASGSGDGEDGEPRCRLRLSGFGHTLIIALPPILKPHRVRAITDREFGFTASHGYLSVSYGRVANDSSTERRWGYFYPWKEWRVVRSSYYDQDGNHFWTKRWTKRRCYKEIAVAKKRCPKVVFPVADYDGELLEAHTMIEEIEWEAGVGNFKWVSWFRKPKLRRSLDIRFSKETGRGKGSWKGGTTGHGIEMLPGELHEAAFRRYCKNGKMTFVEPVKLWLRTPRLTASPTRCK